MGVVPRSVMGQIELSLNTTFKRLPKSHTRGCLQMNMVGIFNNFGNILLALGDVLSNVSHGFLICDSVADTDTKAVME